MKFQSALMPPPLHYNHYGDFDMYPSRLLNCFIIFKKISHDFIFNTATVLQKAKSFKN